MTTRLLHSMRRDGVKNGVVGMCIGGGQGIALALEMIASGLAESSKQRQSAAHRARCLQRGKLRMALLVTSLRHHYQPIGATVLVPPTLPPPWNLSGDQWRRAMLPVPNVARASGDLSCRQSRAVKASIAVLPAIMFWKSLTVAALLLTASPFNPRPRP